MFVQLTLWHWFAIGLGGALGAILRFVVSDWANKLLPGSLPMGSLAVNIVGSLLMGIAFVFFSIKYTELSIIWQRFVMVGLLGAFTTFSTFALECLMLIVQAHYFFALGYILLSVMCCLIAVSIGYGLGWFIFH